MRFFLRLPVVLSVIWLLLSFSSFYAVDFFHTEKIANTYYAKCIKQQEKYLDNLIIESDCKIDKEKILVEWSQTKFIAPLFFAILSLVIFWIIGLIFMRTSKWAQSGG